MTPLSGIQTMNLRPFLTLLISVLLLPAASGCKSIGPGTVRRDRLHYATAVADSWKEQLLLNIVKTRYADAPAFMEVASVVSGYSLETGISLDGQYTPAGLSGDTFAAGGVSGKYTDRPTISYSPMTGERYARSLLAPVPLEPLLFVIQGGVPVDFFMGLTVQSLEGRRNTAMFGGSFHGADPEFLHVLGLLRVLQQASAIEAEIVYEEQRQGLWLRFHPGRELPAGEANTLPALKTALGIPAGAEEVKVVFGTFHGAPGVVAIRTRSLMQVLSALGAGVEIPAPHLTDGSASPMEPAAAPRGFKVRSGKDRPEAAFVTVPYEDHWFWIDRNDLPAKTTLAAVTMLFNFLEGGNKTSPVLTIPTN